MKFNRFLTIALMTGMTLGTVTSQGFAAYAETGSETSSEAGSQTGSEAGSEANSEGNTSSEKNEVTYTNGASEGTYTLKINNTGKTTHTFEIYQIFKGTLSDDKKVLSDIKWGDGISIDDLPSALKDVAWGNGVILSDDDIKENAAKVANGLTNENAESFAKGISKALSVKTAEAKIIANNNATLKLPTGYYFVRDSEGSQNTSEGSYTQYLLQITADTETTTKLDAPTSLKKVKEDDHEVTGTTDSRLSSFEVGDHFNDVADYSIGEKIPYELVGTLPSNYAKYTTYQYSFVDTMSSGLDVDKESVKVYFRPSVDSNQSSEKEVTSKASVDVSEDLHSLNVSFSDLKAAVPEATEKFIFIVRYEATLNENAVVGLPGNTNEFHLEYSNNPNGEGKGTTPEDKNIVFTYELDNEKITYISEAEYNAITDDDKDKKYTKLQYDLNGDGTAETVYKRTLTGAKFKLFTTSKNEDTGAKGAVIENGVFMGWDDVSKATEVASDENGLVKIKGLDSGVYYLEETEAPSGYNKLTNRVKLEIKAETVNNQSWESMDPEDALKKTETDKDGNVIKTALTVTLDDKTTVNSDSNLGIVKTEIVNFAGSTLPSTGGIGTTIMYAVGGLLVILGGAAIIIKRRSDAE